MENPLLQAMKAARLTRAQLARRAGVSYATVSWTLLGYAAKPSEAILRVLASEGLDIADLERRYIEWRKAQQVEQA